MPGTTLVASAVYIFLSVASLALITYLAYRLLRKLLAYLFRDVSIDLFGSDPKVRMISLGVATLIFYNVPAATAFTVGNILYQFFGTVKESLIAKWAEASPLCGSYEQLSQCTSALSFGFVKGWSDGLGAAYNAVPQGFPYAGLILYLAVWAVVAYLLGEAQVAQANGATLKMTRGRLWVSSAYNNLGWNATLNLLFFLILGMGLYLSIASIIAIPILQESTAVPEELTGASLKKRLEDTLKDMDKFPLDNVVEGQPFEPLNAIIGGADEKPAEEKPAAASPTASAAAGTRTTPASAAKPADAAGRRAAGAPRGLEGGGAGRRANDGGGGQGTEPRDGDGAAEEGDEATKAVESLHGRIRGDLDRYEKARQQMIGMWVNFLETSKNSQRVALVKAVNSYEVNLRRKGEGERGRREHLLSLTNWFDTRGEYFEYTLRNCQRAIRDQDEDFKSWARYAALRLNTLAASRLAAGDANFATNYYGSREDADRSTQGLQQFCTFNEPPQDLFDIPQPSSEGNSLGYFRLIAQWLVTTESLSLALITGLLGFGLLGSACSTFIREHEEKKSSGVLAAAVASPNVRLLVGDLTGVAIRGMSAAIVVFLSVEGGLAIFATKGSEPNPYVLLLTCFVGAVFSERVWEWARDKYLQSPEDPDDDGDDDGDGDGDGKAVKVVEVEEVVEIDDDGDEAASGAEPNAEAADATWGDVDDASDTAQAPADAQAADAVNAQAADAVDAQAADAVDAQAADAVDAQDVAEGDPKDAAAETMVGAARPSELGALVEQVAAQLEAQATETEDGESAEGGQATKAAE